MQAETKTVDPEYGDRPALTGSCGLGALSVFPPNMRNFELALPLGRPIQSRRPTTRSLSS
jgi:hypothetical protein